MLDNFSVQCPHGYRSIDADECVDCLAVEVAKMRVIKSVEEILSDYTDDSATKALVLTAVGKYVSIKLARAEQEQKVLQGIKELMPCLLEGNPMVARQHFLTELSFEVYE